MIAPSSNQRRINYIVAFSFTLEDAADAEYQQTMGRLMSVARENKSFVKEDAVRLPDGSGLSVSYWRDLKGIEAWAENVEHKAAKLKGVRRWYKEYALTIAKVEHSSEFSRAR